MAGKSGNKKLLSFISVLALTATLVAGCGSGNKDGGASSAPSATQAPSTASASQAASATPADNAQTYGDTGGLQLPLVDKPTTITMMVTSEFPAVVDSMLVKEIEKRTGIKLELQPYSAEVIKDKRKFVIASGKLPDIFAGLSLAEVNKLGSQGALAPINKFLDILPNFKSLYVDNPDNNWVMKSWSDENNNMYEWPTYGLNRAVNHGFLYRKDIFDKLGIAEWTNTEEFYQALKKLKEAYPDSYPYASKTKEVIFYDWSFGWGYGANSQIYPASYDEATGAWELFTTSSAYKDELDFLKKLYTEGLLDPEFITDTSASWTAKMVANDKAFVTFDWIGRLDMFATQVKAENPDYNLRYGNPVGPNGTIRSLPKVTYGPVIANTDKKEAALKLLDYLSSLSGSELVTMGVEGQTYVMENGKPVYPELKDMPVVDINTLTDKYGLWLDPMYVRPDPRSVYFNFTEKEQEAQDKILKNNSFSPSDPELKFTDEEAKTIAEAKVALDKAAAEFSIQYVMKKDSGDAQWQEWLRNADKLGAKSYIDTYNATQKRFDEMK